MKFKFYENESKIYDFLKFPKSIYYKEYIKKINDENEYSDEFISDRYIDYMKAINEKLLPYTKEIEKYYTKEVFNHEFIELLMHTYSFCDYKTSKEYLDFLLTLSESELKETIIHNLKDIYDFFEEDYTTGNEINFINDLPIDTPAKWNLLLILQDPLKYTKDYVSLMYKLYPIFIEFYNPLTKEITEYANKLVNYLNKNGPEGITKLSYSLVSPKIFKNEINKILVSTILPYSISIIDLKDGNLLIWGTKVENALQKLKERNENKLNERVQIFKNLGDKTRYEVLRLIAQGITSTKKIADTLGVSSATISYHINNFLTSKVIKLNPNNRKQGYTVDYEVLEETIKGFKEDLLFPKSE